tara:strand:- start:14413 stop:14616 length:204 start_codon:yes stop_codon:yes gene_type:complete
MMSEASLKKNLNDIVKNVVVMIENAEKVEVRRSLFNEYKEWLGETINDDVLYLPRNFNQKKSNKSYD